MIRNYLKIALRNILRHKMISAINLLGLSVGLTCCILILIYVLNELSYDRYNASADRIYRVTRSFNTSDGIQNLHLGSIAPPFGPLLKNDFSEIEKTTRVLPNGNTVTRYQDKVFTEEHAFYAEENFFDFFSIPLVSGDPEKALADPGSIMLSEDLARKYFGNADPMNKMLRLDNLALYKVSGVFKPFPANSHFHPEMLISFKALNDSTLYGERQLMSNFSNNAFFTYAMFPANYPVSQTKARFPAFIDKYMKSGNPAKKVSGATQLHLQKLTDIHLTSHLDDELEENGDIKRVYIFSCIALFILLIACINFMNLSTARSALRAKEIGIRKVIGALRRELILQFLSESVLITFISLLLALLFTYFSLNFVNKISGLHLSFRSLTTPGILACLIMLPFVLGILSGIYPALFLSAFNPARVLKGFFRSGKGVSFRQVLVVSQFTVSIILIVATLVVFRQLNYMQNISLGFNKTCVLTMQYPGQLNEKFESFRNEITRKPSIQSIARSSRVPTGRLLDDLGGVSVLNGDTLSVVPNADVKFVTVDPYFIPTYGIGMAAGRNFSPAMATDSNNFVLNEAATRALGWKTPDEAIDRTIRYGGVRGRVIGVMKDFHFESKHQAIIPLLLSMPNDNYLDNLTVKTGPDIKQALADLEKVWTAYLPEFPFRYMFMDERIGELYRTEEQQATLFTIFSFIAIFIACLGLFGLSVFTIGQRIKEIGIRKVLGASIPGIVSLLSKDFLKLVCLAALMGLPVSWYLMHQWLQDFAYRINVPWWAFLVASLAAILIAFLTISIQSLKAANANPVKNLRTE